MKYSELEKKAKKIGCFDTGKKMNGHPLWYSPITDKYFKMSHHKSEEVKLFQFNYCSIKPRHLGF